MTFYRGFVAVCTLGMNIMDLGTMTARTVGDDLRWFAFTINPVTGLACSIVMSLVIGNLVLDTMTVVTGVRVVKFGFHSMTSTTFIPFIFIYIY